MADISPAFPVVYC